MVLAVRLSTIRSNNLDDLGTYGGSSGELRERRRENTRNALLEIYFFLSLTANINKKYLKIILNNQRSLKLNSRNNKIK